MGKPFFEVFPSLKLNKSIHDIMEQTSVEKVSATKQKDFLRIYLYSTRLIVKEDIWETERQIKEQFFSSANLTVKIYERFELSSQYNAEKLLDIYRESILAELRDYSHIEYMAFKTAQITYPESDRVLVTVDDTVLNKSKEEELIRVLEKVLVERCGLSVKIQMDYREAKTGKFEEEDELKIRMKVNAIYTRVKGSGGDSFENAGANGESAAENNKLAESAGQIMGAGGDSGNGAGNVAAGANGEQGQGAAGKASGGTTKSFQGKTEFKRGEFKKGEFRKGGDFGKAKRSDNPDVIYGRDFEEDAMKIEDIIGEMGEVVIRGKILSLDTREIKNEKTIIIFDVTDFTDTMTVKLFARNDRVKEILSGVKPGAFVKIKGISLVDKFDHELTIGSVAGIKKIPDFTVSRMDTAPHKRVELHCHTKMSDMDGVSEAKDIVKRAYKWG
ncbi:MAG: PolC-type DNA polymerase III, partial [Eubacterium sp.]|nr:PolC-type DNA polymerase III [Eubacterium sp.]